LGATWKVLGSGVTEIVLDEARTWVSDNTCAIDDPVTLGVLADKPLTYQLLEEEGLPTPRHTTFTLKRLSTAITFLEQAGGDCVIKPARGTGGGRGITAGVRTRRHLARAAAAAAAYCNDILIEEQIEGDNYRLLYLDGELIDAFVRRSPSVVGDGQSTIARLIRDANEDRLRHGTARSQVLLTVDMDVRRTLDRQGYALRSVPPKGAVVNLKTVVNENCGADNSSCAHLLSASIIEDGARAVRKVQARLAGVDVIVSDPAATLQAGGGVILEVNAPPNFYYHYHKKDGAFPVAVHVLRRLLVERNGMSGALAAGLAHEGRLA
jgi:cyanophycin synthetase